MRGTPNDKLKYLQTASWRILHIRCQHQFFIMADYFIEENELTKQIFDLDEILAFQLENDVQSIRGEDYQYMCYINKSVYATGLTPMFALSYGIKVFKERS